MLRRVLSVVTFLALVPATLFANPLLVKKIGGEANDIGTAVAVDGSGNFVVLGDVQGTVDFGGGPDPGLGYGEVFLAKYTSTGSYLWSRRLGGNLLNIAGDVAVDASNNVYVTGWCEGTANFGGSSLAGFGNTDIFLAKYDSNGNHLWSRRFGGPDRDGSRGLAVDASGNVAITGRIEDGHHGVAAVDFGGGPLRGGIFIAKYTTDGAHLWSKRYGGFGQYLADEGMDVAFDPSGNLIAVGYFGISSINFGGDTFIVNGAFDAYVVKLDAAGNHVWSRKWSGPGAELFNGVDVDGSGDVYAAGFFSQTADFGGGPYSSSGSADIIIAKYGSASGDHVWSRHYGGTGLDMARGIDVDTAGNVVVSGFYDNDTVDFDGHPAVNAGDYDIFFLTLDPGGVLQSSFAYGGVTRDVGEDCKWTASGGLLVTGRFEDTVDFGNGPLRTNSGGGAPDAFVLHVGLTPANTPPVARCKDVTMSAGANCTAAASIDDGSSDSDSGDTITLAQTPPGPYPIGTTFVTLTVTDSHGASSSCGATVTVNNPAPVATITGPASGSVFVVNSVVPFEGNWADANGGPHAAQWAFDGVADASFSAGTGTSGAANTSHTFTAVGVYTVSLAVADACAEADTASQVDGLDALVVVYDPNAGFVTGGGWIDSPPGAYTAAPLLTGKANFGFVSKYLKGATVPTGETEFRFKVGNLNFHSTSYDWLVVAGARAQYKGSGTINGAGDYSFMLTAIDGQISGGQDKFRMKITNKAGGGLVYDNLLNAPDSNDPTTLLGGGSIVIHSGGSRASAEAETPRDIALRAENALAANVPNPFNQTTRIGFSLAERSRVRLGVYDLAGREVRAVVEGELDLGPHSVILARTAGDGSRLGAGVYFLRLSAQSLSSGQTFQLLRKIVLAE